VYAQNNTANDYALIHAHKTDGNLASLDYIAESRSLENISVVIRCTCMLDVKKKKSKCPQTVFHNIVVLTDKGLNNSSSLRWLACEVGKFSS
jgi:hypothetical protein